LAKNIIASLYFGVCVCVCVFFTVVFSRLLLEEIKTWYWGNKTHLAEIMLQKVVSGFRERVICHFRSEFDYKREVF